MNNFFPSLPPNSKLIILNEIEKDSHGNRVVVCQCKCGNLITRLLTVVKTGRCLSCGCLVPELRFKHGYYGSRTYTSWNAMWKRCKDPKNEYYGAKGITVCDRWKDFRLFLEDMGERPLNCSLDRIENTLGYSKSNCCWSTRQQQNSNRSSIIFLTFNGKTQTLSAWARELGVRKQTLWRRYQLTPNSSVLSKPVRKYVEH